MHSSDISNGISVQSCVSPAQLHFKPVNSSGSPVLNDTQPKNKKTTTNLQSPLGTQKTAMGTFIFTENNNILDSNTSATATDILAQNGNFLDSNTTATATDILAQNSNFLDSNTTATATDILAQNNNFLVSNTTATATDILAQKSNILVSNTTAMAMDKTLTKAKEKRMKKQNSRCKRKAVPLLSILKPQFKKEFLDTSKALPSSIVGKVAACCLSDLFGVKMCSGLFVTPSALSSKKYVPKLVSALRTSANTAARKKSRDAKKANQKELVNWDTHGVKSLEKFKDTEFVSKIAGCLKTEVNSKLSLHGFVESVSVAREAGLAALADMALDLQVTCRVGQLQESSKIAVALASCVNDGSVRQNQMMKLLPVANSRGSLMCLHDNLTVLLQRFGPEILLCLPFLQSFGIENLTCCKADSLRTLVFTDEFNGIKETLESVFAEEHELLSKLFSNKK
jgi:hypothetical protein